MKHPKILWSLLAIVSVLLTLLMFLPASWMGSLLDKQTNGRLSLGDTQGSFWNGSGFLGVAADQNSPVAPLFPGRFSWKVSPKLLLGQIDVEINNHEVFDHAVNIVGDFSQWQVSENSMKLPPERLEGLGAPLNTIGPSGKLTLSWKQLDFILIDALVNIHGKMQLDMQEMASRISSIKPLGSYQLSFNWLGSKADLQLSTTQGPLMLEGRGGLQNGRLQFSGKAYASAEQEERLAGLLNLLGRRRQEGNKQVIALEFK
jgi:general secretion pathway protein N